MGQRPEKLGIVLIAHGSRREEANRELETVAERLRERGFDLVFPAYLELAQPDVAAAASQCIAAGADHVILAPYFLSAGRHAVLDLEALRQQVAQSHSRVPIKLADPLGPHPLLETILCERIEQARARR